MYPQATSQFTRFLSSDHQRFYRNSETFLPQLFQHVNIHPGDDSDDADEEEEDDDKTPTVTRPSPKYPQE